MDCKIRKKYKSFLFSHLIRKSSFSVSFAEDNDSWKYTGEEFFFFWVHDGLMFILHDLQHRLDNIL